MVIGGGSISEKMTEFSRYFLTTFSHAGKNSEKISFLIFCKKISFSQKFVKSSFFIKSKDLRKNEKNATFYIFLRNFRENDRIFTIFSHYFFQHWEKIVRKYHDICIVCLMFYTVFLYALGKNPENFLSNIVKFSQNDHFFTKIS